ncbi:MAG TPA: zinc ribbon domain-containing protein, partial [Streptosporangiaceae bacterium]|nr:zinc ribbon domain-containing protein [Streptosporangiaceae bacterium]
APRCRSASVPADRHRSSGSLPESQARFVCAACGFACNADVNAARNIAAGHAVTARGGDKAARPRNGEPQLLASLQWTRVAGIPCLQAEEAVKWRYYGLRSTATSARSRP